MIETNVIPFRFFLGFHKGAGFGFKHIQAVHGIEIRNAGFTRIEDFVTSIVRPGTKLYHTGESLKKSRLLAWNQTGMGVLEFRDRGKHWSIVTAYAAMNPLGTLVGEII